MLVHTSQVIFKSLTVHLFIKLRVFWIVIGGDKDMEFDWIDSQSHLSP